MILRSFIETDIQHPKKLPELHNDIPFLPERMKIEKPVANLHDREDFKTSIKSWISF